MSSSETKPKQRGTGVARDLFRAFLCFAVYVLLTQSLCGSCLCYVLSLSCVCSLCCLLHIILTVSMCHRVVVGLVLYPLLLQLFYFHNSVQHSLLVLVLVLVLPWLVCALQGGLMWLWYHEIQKRLLVSLLRSGVCECQHPPFH